MSDTDLTVLPFLYKVNDVIINPLLVLLFFIAFLVFFFGIFEFIRDAGDGTKRSAGKKKIVYGLVGMVIMFSAYGLIRLVLNTFGLDTPSYLQGP